MNKLIRLMTLSALVAAFALPAFARMTASLLTDETAALVQTDEEAKAALYKKFTENFKTNQAVAYETAKEYLAKYPAEDQYSAYIKKWMTAYEKGKRKIDLDQMIKDRKFAEAFALGKQIIADEPNDLTTLSALSWAGLNLATTGKDATNMEAATYARKTLGLIESGKSFEEGKPLEAKTKNDNMNWLNYALAIFALKSNPNEALNYLMRTTQIEGPFQKDPQTYALLAIAYQAGPYKKLSDEFEANYRGKDETPESKAALENLNQVIDRVVDAYARAVALATAPEYAAKKTEWTTQLTNFYKFRHNDSDVGLKEYIAGILSKPLPPPPVLNATPAPTTSSATPAATTTTTTTGTTPATNTTTTTGPTNTAPASTTPPATTKPATNTTPPPATTTTPSKPKAPVRN